MRNGGGIDWTHSSPVALRPVGARAGVLAHHGTGIDRRNAMIKSTACLLALVFAAHATTGLAQPVASAEGESPAVAPSPTPPLPVTQPRPPAVNAPREPRNVTIGPCDTSGCWAADGTRYNRIGGNTLVGRDGRMCQYVGSGLPLACP
jgi:hypothetical protein